MSQSATDPEHDCVARSVATALAENPGLEAVTINRKRQTISIATLGRTDIPALEQAIQKTVEQAAEASSHSGCALFAADGDCHACAHPLPSAQSHSITVHHEGDATTIARVTCPTAPKFWRWRVLPLPRVVPRELEVPEDEEHLNEWKPQLAAAVACGVLGLAAYSLHHAGLVSTILYALAYVAGSWFAAEEVLERLRKGAIDIHFLMLAVAGGSAAIGAWGEGAMLLFLFSFAGALEHYAMGRTQREIRALYRDAPKTATVIEPGGHERELPVESLRPSMRLLVKPGAQFPVDSEIVKGTTAADESNLTGEAAPVDKSVGSTAYAGTLNLWGAVELVALRPAAQSSLQNIIRLIREAQQRKAPAQQFTDSFSAYYTYVVLGLSLLMFFVWWLALGLTPFKSEGGTQSAFYRTMTLLVVASPCALVLSIPSAILAAIAWGARHGVLFRGGAAVEKLAGITTVALDKTGTLTTGELKVETIQSFPPGREPDIAALAYSLEKLSTHPLARAIERYARTHTLQALEVQEFQSNTGHGLVGRIGSQRCFAGRREWVLENGAPGLALPESEAAMGVSEIWMAHGALAGRILLRDDIRPQSKEVLELLRNEGLRTIVLTGDRSSAAEHLRQELGVKEVKAELRPEQKLAEIRSLTSAGERVAMVGDGVNDAPSLAAAHIGVAMGARGADAALEQADVVLMRDRLENFLSAFVLSKRARTIIRQNLLISLGTVVVLVGFALAGKIPLTLGVVGHEGSTVLVVMNSLRLLLGQGAARTESQGKALALANMPTVSGK